MNEWIQRSRIFLLIFIFSKIYRFVDNIQGEKNMSLEALSILESLRFFLNGSPRQYHSTFSIWATSTEYLIKFNFLALALRKEFQQFHRTKY